MLSNSDTSNSSNPGQAMPRASAREFRDQDLFFSTTDRKGIISTGNRVFTAISGYTDDELLGAPHNIIRHPDMPRCVFRLLWDFLTANKKIVAYVKNMSKDGAYYWVLATAMPISNGYLSIRIKPNSKYFGIVKNLYAELKECELSIETTPAKRRQAIEQSTALLLQKLATLGYSDYSAFMQDVLVEELREHNRILMGATSAESDQVTRGIIGEYAQRCNEIDYFLGKIFNNLSDFEGLNKKLAETSTMVSLLSSDIGGLALNASIKASRLGEIGRTLSVVAEVMSRGAGDIAPIIGVLNEAISETARKIKQTGFDICLSKLQIEMTRAFLKEIAADTGSGSAELGTQVRLLLSLASASLTDMTASLKSFGGTLNGLSNQADILQKTIKTIGFIHVNGKVESARLIDSTEFCELFDRAFERLESVKANLLALTGALTATKPDYHSINGIDYLLRKAAVEENSGL